MPFLKITSSVLVLTFWGKLMLRGKTDGRTHKRWNMKGSLLLIGPKVEHEQTKLVKNTYKEPFSYNTLILRMSLLNMRSNCDLGIAECRHMKLFRGSHRG